MLKEKVALVTGASSGIGKAIALALAKEGAIIAINYYPGNSADADEVVKYIQDMGGQAMAVAADISKATDVDEMVSKVISEMSKVDILVNNAGITRDTLIMRMKEEDWDAVLNTNLKGSFLCTKAVIRPMMKQRAGRIINIASVVGVTGNAGQANYSAAKAGLIGLTKTTAKELASRGITVNAVAPGFIATNMTDVLSEEVKENLLGVIPMGKLGQPEDIANAVVFLASDNAQYITGQTINVNGGMMM